MKDATEAELREWQQSPATIRMVEELRRLLSMSIENTMQAAESASSTLQEITLVAGRANGIRAAIYHLTKERK